MMPKVKEMLENEKKLIRSVLLSNAPRGVLLDKFGADYKLLTCSDLHYKQYGFTSIEEMLRAIPDVARFKTTEAGAVFVHGIPKSTCFNGYLSFKKEQPKKTLLKTPVKNQELYSVVFDQTPDFRFLVAEHILKIFDPFSPVDCFVIQGLIFLRFHDVTMARACLHTYSNILGMRPAMFDPICRGMNLKNSSNPNAGSGKVTKKESSQLARNTPLPKAEFRRCPSSAGDAASKKGTKKGTSTSGRSTPLPTSPIRRCTSSLGAKSVTKTKPVKGDNSTKSGGYEVFLGNIALVSVNDIKSKFGDSEASSMWVEKRFGAVYLLITFDKLEKAEGYVKKWNGVMFLKQKLFCNISISSSVDTTTEQHSDKGCTKAQSKTSMTKVFRPAIADAARSSGTGDTSDSGTSSQCDCDKLTSRLMTDLKLYKIFDAASRDDSLPTSSTDVSAAEKIDDYIHLPPLGEESEDDDEGGVDDDVDEGLSLDNTSSCSSDPPALSTVQVFNFPHNTTHKKLLKLFSQFRPSTVDIINTSNKGKRTHAILKLCGKEMAKLAQNAVNQTAYEGCVLTVAEMPVQDPVDSGGTVTNLSQKNVPKEIDVFAALVKKHWPGCTMVQPLIGQIEAHVTFAVDDRHFYASPIIDKSDPFIELRSLNSSINDTYSMSEAAWHPGLCGARHAGIVKRAWLCGINEHEGHVIFLDSGNYSVLDLKETRDVTNINFWFHPPFCQPFRLIDTKGVKLKDMEDSIVSLTVLSFDKRTLLTTVRLS